MSDFCYTVVIGLSLYMYWVRRTCHFNERTSCIWQLSWQKFKYYFILAVQLKTGRKDICCIHTLFISVLCPVCYSKCRKNLTFLGKSRPIIFPYTVQSLWCSWFPHQFKNQCADRAGLSGLLCLLAVQGIPRRSP